jgi:hypothetical protein
MFYFAHRIIRSFQNFVFPKALHLKAQKSQLLNYPCVASAISRDFLGPERGIRFRRTVTLRTAVPEAAIHKDGESLFRKY